MNHSLIFIVPLVVLLSCQTKTTNIATNKVQVLMADTANNNRAQWDLSEMNAYCKIAKQLGLTNLKKGADSLEIRLWNAWALSNIIELYTIQLRDTGCLVSFYRIYQRMYDYDHPNKNWNPYTDPIVDSSISKSALVNSAVYRKLQYDSIWLLKSQSELGISDTVGFLDCYSNSIEVADKNRFRYLRYHCATGYYEKTKLQAIVDFEVFVGKIKQLVKDHNIEVPYHYTN